MSVTFSITGRRVDLDDPSTYLNLNNRNAYDLLAWLGLLGAGDELFGQVPARELVARCRRRLWDEPRNHDPALDAYAEASGGGARVFVAGRAPGYLRQRTAELLALGELAGDGEIRWD